MNTDKLTAEAFTNLVGNKMFTVSFTKLNGETRTLNGRLGVHKYTRGGGNTTKGREDVITMYVGSTDTKYRKFSLDRLQSLKVNRYVYLFDISK